MRFHSNAHLPESEESEEQPGLHGFVPHSSEEKPLHSLRHSWETTFTGGAGTGTGSAGNTEEEEAGACRRQVAAKRTDEG